MPQENCVLKCYSCETFQVHIVKKSKKWECKICGAKQSLQHVYGKGSGKDCRVHVMKLNELRIQKKDYNEVQNIELQIPHEEFNAPQIFNKSEKKINKSKWTEYLDENEVTDEDEFLDNNTDTICHNINKSSDILLINVRKDNQMNN